MLRWHKIYFRCNTWQTHIFFMYTVCGWLWLVYNIDSCVIRWEGKTINFISYGKNVDHINVCYEDVPAPYESRFVLLSACILFPVAVKLCVLWYIFVGKAKSQKHMRIYFVQDGIGSFKIIYFHTCDRHLSYRVNSIFLALCVNYNSFYKKILFIK